MKNEDLKEKSENSSACENGESPAEEAVTEEVFIETLTEKLKEAQEALTKKETEASENWNRFLRERAEMDNL